MRANEERLRHWIEKADHDLGTAIIINEHIPEYNDIVAFHSQQAVEKYLKCLLEQNAIAFRKTHDLRYLLDLLTDVIVIDLNLYEQVMKLNAFGVEVRYPDYRFERTAEERNEAITIAQNIRTFVIKNLDFKFKYKSN
jgi:HEPN domain-containing protein